ncbi:hypothetical protein J2Y69_003287 [Microbacterium resistens]|uniref:Tetratricopeptide repeat protein n=1 Tax=Microbacterium resistens TaxID=156977 RepID=A0ABU1SGC8_9MICO|nr:hypothetical protein [Microbacterium resistens]MDR6868663.1 hypothetical protein [Microbacterium resistens]
MGSRIGVIVMAVCLTLYILLAGQRAIALLATGTPIAITMGVALIVLPLIGIWALVREIQFGLAADRLTRILRVEGRLPDDEVGLTPSGRVDKEDAPALLHRYTSDAEAEPADWRARLRLGIVQDATGNRRAARASVREAIRVEKASR